MASIPVFLPPVEQPAKVPTPAPAATPIASTPVDDWQAEAQSWKKQARKHEDRHKRQRELSVMLAAKAGVDLNDPLDIARLTEWWQQHRR